LEGVTPKEVEIAVLRHQLSILRGADQVSAVSLRRRDVSGGLIHEYEAAA